MILRVSKIEIQLFKYLRLKSNHLNILNNRKKFKLNNILVSSRNNFDYGLVPRNFRPRSPIYSPPISISDEIDSHENSFTPIRDNLPENNSNIDYDLLNAFVD